MTKEELAAKLMGIQRCYDIYAHQEEAKENGLIIIFVQDAYMTEFIGSFQDSVRCYDEKVVYIDTQGVLKDFDENIYEDDKQFRNYFRRKNASKILKIINGFDDRFTYEINIPHANFSMYDEDDLYCIGIVISVEDLKE